MLQSLDYTEAIHVQFDRLNIAGLPFNTANSIFSIVLIAVPCLNASEVRVLEIYFGSGHVLSFVLLNQRLHASIGMF